MQQWSSNQFQNSLTTKPCGDDHRAAADQGWNQRHALGVNVIKRKNKQGAVGGRQLMGED